MALPTNEASCSSKKPLLRCLEFYSGMGGLHYSLSNACAALSESGEPRHAEVVMAFDINTIANSVYQHNFNRTVSPKTILSLTNTILDKYSASDLWLLSPPCQPYTRQGKQKDTEDPRAESFLHLISVIPTMANPPRMLLIENVVGFESSETRERLITMLRSLKYHIQEFHLSPDQISIPNSRTRYFCLASLVSAPIHTYGPDEILKIIPGNRFFAQDAVSQCSPLSQFLEDRSTDEDGGKAYFSGFMVPESVLIKSGMSFDIVFADSYSSNCFTKNYGRLVEGAGSVLQTAPKSVQGIPNQPESLKALQLRYFTPREICRLHGFPETCDLSRITTKQAYALLGNSLNVSLVSELLVYLLSWPSIEPQ